MGLSLEAGNVWDDTSQVSTSALRLAGALYAGADTPLEPLYLAWGLAEDSEKWSMSILAVPSTRKAPERWTEQ